MIRVVPGTGFGTAEQHTHAYLRDLILSGELAGGERINQDAIARQLGVSRMPVREAIRRLDSEGLVVNRPNRGAVVTILGPEAILELFEMRSALEGLAISLGLPHIGAKAVLELEDRLERMEQAQSNTSLWMQRHDEFHDYICQHARRPRLAAYVRSLRQNVAPYLRLYLSTYKEAEMPGFEHRTLLNAVKRGDVPAAEQMMRDHVLSAAQGIVEFIRRSEPSNAGHSR